MATALGAVAVSTALIYPLKSVAPAVSLGVVYIPGVLLVSTFWGIRLGLLTALLSTAAFNWFHIPPVGRFTIADSRNWVALATFGMVAIASSTIAQIARARASEAERRRREADLAAALARALLGGTGTGEALAGAAAQVADALGLESADLRPGRLDPPRGYRATPLQAGGEQIATLLVPDGIPDEAAARLAEQVAPTLEALIAIGLQRDRMQEEAVETAALRRSDELKTALLRSVSHDLRTPLTSMLAAGAALGSPSLTSSEREELSDAVVGEGTRLSRLVENLLDISRLQAGRAEPRRDPVDLAEIIEAARFTLGGEGGSFHVAVDPDLPTLHADADQLERAFANLLENAARHGNGSPVLVRSRQVGPRLIVRVVDQGPGIPEAERELIFEPFYRASHGGAEHAGAGLGLAIAQGFIEAHGGEISVESLPGQGTSFVVSFPLPDEVAQ